MKTIQSKGNLTEEEKGHIYPFSYHGKCDTSIACQLTVRTELKKSLQLLTGPTGFHHIK